MQSSTSDLLKNYLFSVVTENHEVDDNDLNKDEWWSNKKALYWEAKQYLQTLRLFNIKQPFSILMTAFFAFPPEKIVSISHGAVYSLQSAGFLNLLSHEIQLRIGIIKMRDILIQASYWEIGENIKKTIKSTT